jgi:transcription antitermination factor NusG
MSEWNIVRTVGRMESRVSKEIDLGLGLNTYYPQEKVKVVCRGKSSDRFVPLIPTYVFVLGVRPSVWRDVAAIKGVIDWRKFAGSDTPAYVTDAQICQVRDLEREFNRAKDDRHTRSLCVGDRVKITKGAFMDMETLLTTVTGREVQFMTPLGIARAPAASVSLVA